MDRIDIKKKAHMVKLLKFLANEKRLDILHMIMHNEHSVGDISKALQLEISTVSEYLNKMRLGGVVKARQDRNNMYYSVKDRMAQMILLTILEFHGIPE